MAWPAEKLMAYDRSYFVAVTNEPQSRHPWVVFAARDSVPTFRDINRTVFLESLKLLQSLYVKEIDEDARVVYLVEARMGAADRYAEAQVTKEWGWVKMSDLLLSHRPFRNPDTFVPQRALIKTAMNTENVAKVPKLYAAPSASAGALQLLVYTSLSSYVYGVGLDDPGEERRPYDPRFQYDWYFVSSRAVLNARPGTDAIGPRDYIGWIRGDHVLIWSTRVGLEPAPGRSRNGHVFAQSDAALKYALNSNRTEGVMLRDDTPTNRTWIGERSRYPLLGQRPQERSGAKAHPIAFQGHVQFSDSAKTVAKRSDGEKSGSGRFTARRPAIRDEPMVTRTMETFIRRHLGEEALQRIREQRTEFHYEGWVPTHDLQGAEIMTPVLFLDAAEAGTLSVIARDVLADTSCYSTYKFFLDLIGTISPESERLPIDVLIEKKYGIRFQSPMLQLPYLEIDSMCSVANHKNFSRLFNSFYELELALEDMRDDTSSQYDRVHRKFYWLPMDKLP